MTMKLQQITRTASIVALCAAAAVMAGCATAVKPEAMIPAAVDAGTHHPQSVNVTVAGGAPTDPLGKSQISNEAFTEAIVSSIEKNKTFSSVVKGANGGDYRLDVAVVSVDQPTFGLSFTVKMEAAWMLKKADGTVVMQETIKSEGTAGATDAFVGTERLRLATETAARNNIAAGIAKLGKLPA
jgi:hypothetical protein